MARGYILVVGAVACGGGTHEVGGDAAASVDARVPPEFVSNTPAARVIDVGTTPNLVLVSSNLVELPAGENTALQWFGEVENVGSETACEVGIDVRFASDAATLATFATSAGADPYVVDGFPRTIPCLAPGSVGTFDDTRFAAALDLAAVTRIEIAFTTQPHASVAPASDGPVVDSHVIPVGDGFGVTGTVTAGTHAIRELGLTIYPRDTRGLVLGRFITNVPDLAPGAAFPFTLGSAPAFDAYRVFADFAIP